jgi:hypothetical protein
VTGFVGTPLIQRVLSAEGEDVLAYHILFNEEYPGWLYEVNLGATTIWERWNSMEADGRVSSTGMNSFNHYAYGSVGEWMWRTMAGLNPDPDQSRRDLARVVSGLRGLKRVTEEMHRRYLELKREKGRIDFADMEQFAYDLLTDPAHPEIREKYADDRLTEIQDAAHNTLQRFTYHYSTGN